MIAFLECLLLTFPSTGTPLRCQCAIRLSKRGGWKTEDQCDFLRRLRLDGLLAGNLSSRKKQNWFNHFRRPPHQRTLLCGERAFGTHIFLPHAGSNGRSRDLVSPLPRSTICILPPLLIYIRPHGSLSRNVIWSIISHAKYYLQRLLWFLTPGWSDEVEGRRT